MAARAAWVAGIGMVTAVGACTAQTASSVRAGISMYRGGPVQNKRFEPMTLALAPDSVLPPLAERLAGTEKLTSRQIRMLRLGHPALLEALDNLPEQHTQPVPLFVSGPEPVPGSAGVGSVFLNLLAAQADVVLDLHESRLFTTGRAGGMQALQAALDVLSAGRHPFVLVGGVDSYLDLNLLATLDREDRVLADGVMDGFAPGEGAAFLLLCSDTARQTLPATPKVRIHAPGLALEAGHRYSEETYTGDGLANALSMSLQALDDMPVRTILSSMNGENFGAKEWGVALIRNSGRIDPDYRFEHPAECFGDSGAAAMPLLAGLAAVGMHKGYLWSPAMALCSSEGALRGSVCLTLEP
jgi:3-oxoacyl-[acyl-carrier-protein] synthase-1